MRRLRMILWLAVAVVAGFTIAVAISGDVRQALFGDPTAQEGVASIGGPFTVVDDTGRTVTEADFLGKPSVYFFGFTYCPDVCPTTLLDMTRWLEAMGADANKLNVAFVTVDPERDTPEKMAAYLSSFDERIVGLTGTPQQVDEMARAWRVYYKKVDTEGGDYTMDHTATVYLMDSAGKFIGTIAFGEADTTAVQKLERLVEGG